MNITPIIALAIALGSAAPAVAQSYNVDGYTRRDGTYVAPYRRSAPDGSRYNNFSTQGNTNPYTGERGYRPATPSYGIPRIPRIPRCGMYGCQ